MEVEAEVGSDLGEPQDLDGGGEFDVSRQAIKQRIFEARTYVENEASIVLDPEVVEMCKNAHKHCAMWR